jgi:hypothetical protein
LRSTAQCDQRYSFCFYYSVDLPAAVAQKNA